MAGKSFPVLFIAPTSVSEAVLASGLLKKLHDEAPNPSFTIIANRAVAPLFAEMPALAGTARPDAGPALGAGDRRALRPDRRTAPPARAAQAIALRRTHP